MEKGKKPPGLTSELTGIHKSYLLDFFTQYQVGMAKAYYNLGDVGFDTFVYYKPGWFLFTQLREEKFDPRFFSIDRDDLQNIDPRIYNTIWTGKVELNFGSEKQEVDFSFYNSCFFFGDRVEGYDKIRGFLEQKHNYHNICELLAFEDKCVFTKNPVLLSPDDYDPVSGLLLTPLDKVTRRPGLTDMYLGELESIQIGEKAEDTLDCRLLFIWDDMKAANKKLC